MNLQIRPPQVGEWPICRMLLPETFADVSLREYLLCLRNESPRIVAAASFRRSKDMIVDLRLHVVTSFRRQGVGSQIVGYLARSGVDTIEGTADIITEPGLEAFARRNRLDGVERFTSIEADMAEMRREMGRLPITLPPDARLISLCDAPVDQVASLHAYHVAQDSNLNPWRFLMGTTPTMRRSPVLMMGDRVVGLILWELEGETVTVRSRVVTPDYQRGWANAKLLKAGLDIAWLGGARRVRFSYTDTNRDTEKLAARFKADVTSVVVRFMRQLNPK